MLSALFRRSFARPTVVLSDLLHLNDSSTRVFQPGRKDMPSSHTGNLIATSYLIDRCEATSSSFLESKLYGNHSSVGFLVQFTHSSWPLVDDRLRFEARVVKVDSRRATFEILVSNDVTNEVIGIGVNGRAVIKYD
jgi:predicted thioesterase